jgi:HK97 family phage major capsid protein
MDGKKLIELKQERATLTTSIRSIMTEFEGKEMDDLKKSELEKSEARFDEVNKLILTEERQLERERVIGERQNEQNQHRNETDKEKEIRSAFAKHLQEGTQQTYAEYRALAMDNPTQAGYLVAPQQFVMELIKDLADATFMRQKAKVLPPLKGAHSLGFPTRTAAMSSFAWGTEIQAPTPDATNAYGKREFKPIPATSEILVSKTLIRNMDGADALVRAEIAEEVAKNLEIAYMTGSGAGQPLGLFTASVDGIPVSRDVSTGNTATEIKFDGLIEAKMAVKAQYRRTAEWVLHRLAIKQIMKLKNTDGQYIWQPSVMVGQPDRLLGDAVNETEYAPSTFTSGLYVGLYGNLKNYWICDSLAMEIQVLMELYARTNQVDYLTRLETDGAPVVPNAFSRIKLG